MHMENKGPLVTAQARWYTLDELFPEHRTPQPINAGNWPQIDRECGNMQYTEEETLP